VRELLLVQQIKAGSSEHGKIMAQHQADFWKLYGDEFDLTEDDTVVVRSNPGIPVAKHIAELAKRQPAWVEGTKAAGGNAGGDGGARPNLSALNAAEVLKNPAAALAAARQKAA
jgi:hypothetical protein